MRLFFAIQEVTKKISKDNITESAASASFYFLLSIIPFLMFLLSMIKFLPIEYDSFLEITRDITPTTLHPLLNGIIYDLYEHTSSTFTIITALGIFWAAGKSIMSLMKCLNKIYKIEEKRSWLFLRILSAFYTFLFMIVILLSLILLVFGNQLLLVTARYTPRISAFIMALLEQKLIVFPAMLILFFIIIYKFIPNRKTSIIKELPGAILSAAGWFIFSFCYSLYVDYSPRFSNMYGSLTTFIFALMWIYICMTIMFWGAEFNTFIQAGIISSKIFKKNKHKNADTN